MAYDLHIYFTGLCVFVPKHDQDGNFEEIRVLMPDAPPDLLPFELREALAPASPALEAHPGIAWE